MSDIENQNEESKNKWEKLSEESEKETVAIAEERVAEPVEGDSPINLDEAPEALDTGALAMQEQLRVAQEEIAKREDAVIRMRAEMENVRRRAKDEVSKAHRYAIDNFVKDLLPVIDSLERGLEAANEVGGEIAAKMIEGMQLTLKMFSEVLVKFGVQVIDPKGEKFDPARHQAMSAQEQDGVEANVVLEVFQKGYLLQDRVLRPAMVVVSK